jgi:alanyl-tRNA synthetase
VGRLDAGTLAIGDRVLGSVHAGRRATILLNHSATHLLHAALRERLGTHVAQKGSLVAPDRLRFDFSHFQSLADDELADVERRVNEEVRANHPVEIRQMDMQEALDSGAMALFGEKYGERVRVVTMGGSVELCGGTHVGRTGEIGLFKLVSEAGVSSGVRRVEALTGQAALDHVAVEERRLADASRLLGGTAGDVGDKLRALLDRQKKLERELEALKARAASDATAGLAGSAVDIGGLKVLAARLEGFDAKALREATDRLRQQLGDAVVVLAGTGDGRAALVAGVAGGAAGKVKAGELVAHVAGRIGGKGGGRPDMAQGGGNDGPELAEALAGIPAWVEARLAS